MKCESFASRFFYLFSKSPWEIAWSQLVEISSVEDRLNKWVGEAGPGENRLEAKNRILACFKEKSPSLDLRKLSLNTLPESIGNLTALTNQVICENRLTARPESVGNLIFLGSLRT